jgi:hypothetical protein
MSKMVEERYRPLAISPMEFAALLGIQLWNSGQHNWKLHGFG